MLRSKARSAVLWSGLNLFARQGVGFVVTIILARLLVPEDFGTIAILSMFQGLAQLFINAGFSTALIQRQSTSLVDESTVFWFNTAAGVVITGCLCLLAPWLAGYFSLPVLRPLTTLMAVNVLISSTCTVHRTLLFRSLDFKTPTKIGVVATVVSGAVAVYMAWLDYGVWALAGRALASAVVGAALLWLCSAWRPLFVFRLDSFRRLFGFGGWLFASSVLDTVYRRGYTLLIGRFYGLYDLGIYGRAENTQQLPTSILTGVLSRVAFPLFSAIKDDGERLRRGVRVSVRSMMLITVPFTLGLAVLAEPFIAVIFGDVWLPAAPILQVLCAVGMLYPLQVINLKVLQAQGHANLFFRLEVVKKCAGAGLLVLGSLFGVMGIAWGRVASSVIALMINSYYTRVHLDYGMRAQFRDCLPSVLIGLVMSGVIALAVASGKFDGGLGLFAMTFLGAFVYVGGNVLVGSRAMREAVSLIRGRW